MFGITPHSCYNRETELIVQRSSQAFTLPELLTVLAILMILAGVLFPVFGAVQGSARQSVCASNFRQAALATTLYVADYDELLMPASYRPLQIANATNDRTWVQLLLPYQRSLATFQCPSDTGRRTGVDGVFDEDLVPGNTDARFYKVSQRSNIGYNYLYLSPILRVRDGAWMAAPRSTSAVADASRTIVFVDSVWDRDLYGIPFGGGNYLVVPPCRYKQHNGARIDSFGPGSMYYVSFGWKTTSPTSGKLYGGAWPWHSGRMTVGRLDGSVRSLTPDQLTSGCALEEDWEGTITRGADYAWDLE